MEGWLTEAGLVAETGASPRRLTWLRQNGLIPRPRRRSRGLHKGTLSLYPPVTVAMIRRLDELAAERRDADEWLWRLWLEGYPIEIGKRLAAKIGAAAELFVGIDNPEMLDTLLTTVRAKRSRKRNLVPARESAGRIIYSRVRQPAVWHSLLYSTLAIALSIDANGGDNWFEIVKRALRLPADWRAPQIDSGNASLSALRNTLTQMSPAETDRARLDCVAISKLSDRFSGLADIRNAPLFLKFFHRQWHDFTFRAALVAFLVILRQSPEISPNIDMLVNGLNWLDRHAGRMTDAA
jgi:hypothetical protein